MDVTPRGRHNIGRFGRKRHLTDNSGGVRHVLNINDTNIVSLSCFHDDRLMGCLRHPAVALSGAQYITVGDQLMVFTPLPASRMMLSVISAQWQARTRSLPIPWRNCLLHR